MLIGWGDRLSYQGLGRSPFVLAAAVLIQVLLCIQMLLVCGFQLLQVVGRAGTLLETCSTVASRFFRVGSILAFRLVSVSLPVLLISVFH